MYIIGYIIRKDTGYIIRIEDILQGRIPNCGLTFLVKLLSIDNYKIAMVISIFDKE